jgi:Ca2+-transporting ATPase
MSQSLTGLADDLGEFDPESCSPEDVLSLLEVDAGRGLSTEEAAGRLKVFGRNELPRQKPPGVLLRLGRQLLDPMAILLLVAAAVAGVALGDPIDAIAIAAIVFLNAAIATLQEGKAASALNALREMESLEARVVRDGQVIPVEAALLVPGDVVLVAAGDRVAADVRVIEAAGLEIDESVLTGESLPVAKDPSAVASAGSALGDRLGMGFSGTIVTRGTARGVVVATGSNSELGTIAGRLGEATRPTPLQDELKRLITVLGFAAIGVAGLSFGLSLLASGGGPGDFETAFLFSVALAVAAVPEGLGTVVTVALAFGVRRMAGRGAIIRRLSAVEGLGSTSVLLTDKTGTLTQNRLRLESLSADGSSDELPETVRRDAMEIAVLCNEATLDPPSGDPLELSFLEAAGAEFVDTTRAAAPVLATDPFDSERKMMSTLHRKGGAFRVLVKGAPEEVLLLSTRALDGSGRSQALAPEFRERLLKAADESAGRGMRMLALAHRDLAAAPAELAEAEQDLTFVALAALRDPPRAEASASIAEARDAGIEMLMLTGDHPGTGLAIARELGMSGDLTTALTGRQLGGSAPEDPMAVRVYARLDPVDKLNIVHRLQEMGHVVAVTGDGVNDSPALHQADIGVAMGRRGSQAAREAADMVITDDNLATIVDAVREGRSIYDNIRKVVEYILAANLAEIMVVLGGLALFPAAGVPLLPLQLLWINLITDGLPAIGLGLEPPAANLMKRLPRPPGERLLDVRRFFRLAGRAVLIALGGLTVLIITYVAWSFPWEHARGMVFTTLALSQLFYAFALRGRRGNEAGGHLARLLGNRWLVAGVFGGAVLQVGASMWAPSRALLGIPWFSAADWGLMGVCSLVPALVIYWLGNSRLAGP